MVDMQKQDLGEFARGEGFAALEIAVDAVLFEDGRLLGPNQSQVDTRFLLLLQRKQELYRAATELMASGNSLDEALAKLKSAIPATAVEMPELLNIDASRAAIGDVLRLRARYGGDRAADAIRRAVQSSQTACRRWGADGFVQSPAFRSASPGDRTDQGNATGSRAHDVITSCGCGIALRLSLRHSAHLDTIRRISVRLATPVNCVTPGGR